jgi:AraC-like DNA-binding protein
MGVRPTAHIVVRRGPRGRFGQLVLAGRATASRGPRPGVDVRFGMFGCTLITAGSGRYIDDHHDTPLGAGSAVLVVPGHRHWYGADEPGWDERFLAVGGPMFRAAAEHGLLDIARPLRRLDHVEVWAARFDHFIDRPHPISGAARDAEAAMVLALLCEIFGDLSHPASAPGERQSGWVEQSRLMLGAQLGTPCPPAHVAAAVGMPYETWRRAFRRETGVSPARFRLDRRLAAAADLLLQTSTSVRTIAAGLGFSDERHLVARFRETYGCTPAAFRARR